MAHVDLYTKTNPNGTVYHFRDDRLPGSGGCMFPVGYIYMSVDSTDPGDIFGGTWERIQDTFLLAAGSSHSAGSTGGAETVTLTADEMPAHTHGSKTLTGFAKFRTTASGGGRMFAGLSGIVSETYTDSSASYPTVALYGSGDNSKPSQRLTVNATHEHDSVGGGQSHSNMPPYLAVYMWKRTA